MNLSFNLLNVIQQGWPVLSVLLLFSILTLASALQCWALSSRVKASLPDGENLKENLDLMEKRLALMGTLANAAPFVGLLGTVIGIIRSFHSISQASGGGLSTVAGGISEALVSTAAGLAVAIPASMLFNYYSFRHQRFTRDAGL